jgi:hypothetical protein
MHDNRQLFLLPDFFVLISFYINISPTEWLLLPCDISIHLVDTQIHKVCNIRTVHVLDLSDFLLLI